MEEWSPLGPGPGRVRGAAGNSDSCCVSLSRLEDLPEPHLLITAPRSLGGICPGSQLKKGGMERCHGEITCPRSPEGKSIYLLISTSLLGLL